jgi:hypothetical protein
MENKRQARRIVRPAGPSAALLLFTLSAVEVGVAKIFAAA